MQQQDVSVRATQAAVINVTINWVMRGMLGFKMVLAIKKRGPRRDVLGDCQNLFHNPAGIWKLFTLNEFRINRGSVNGANAFDWSIEVIEGMILDEHGYHCRNTTEGF